MKIDPTDNASNQTNLNRGSEGTNLQYDQVHGTRGHQLNATQTVTPVEAAEIAQRDVYWYDSNGD